MHESLNYSFRNPKKHNLSNLPYQTFEKLQKNHGVLRGPQLGKQRWRAKLGILRVKTYMDLRHWTLGLYSCVQHRYHTALPTQTTTIHNQCPMVYHKPRSASRSAHPTSSNGIPGTDSSTSLHPELSSKPAHGAASKPSKKPTPQT
jgi:hypothetical protein